MVEFFDFSYLVIYFDIIDDKSLVFLVEPGPLVFGLALCLNGCDSCFFGVSIGVAN